MWSVDTGENTVEQIRVIACAQVQKMSKRLSQTLDQNDLEKAALVEALKRGPIACNGEEVDTVIYDFDIELWKAYLGERMKISSGLWREDSEYSLTKAEEAMLELYIERAELKDGQDILDLGCGYGCIILYLAQRFPGSWLVGHTNSQKQVAFIRSEIKRLNLTNVIAFCNDINELAPDAASFDRVIAIQLLEYMNNYHELLLRISKCLRPNGLFFAEFCVHATHCYEPLEIDTEYTGEFGRSFDFLEYFQEDLSLRNRWWVDGRMYGRTMEVWLNNWHVNRNVIMSVLQKKYGMKAEREYRSQECYFIISIEASNFDGGNMMGPAHYLFQNVGDHSL